MKEVTEPAIRLFGMNLAFFGQDCGDSERDHDRISVMATCLEDKKDCRTEEEGGEAENKDPQAGIPNENEQDKSTTPESSPESDESPKTHSSVEETAVAKPLNTETTDQSDTNGSPQEKQPLKKPDKILPCPRCNSMDTKFCYYNNYNVNQPRHFCKSCQRYWTAGGTMRSVPVGAGRRKNKNYAASHYRHITISETEALRAPNGIHHPAHRANVTVLSFGPEAAPDPESLASVLNIAAKRTANGPCNGFYKVENGGENGDDCSSGSSITTSNSTEERARNGIQESITKQTTQCMGLSPIPCLPGVPWPYPWNSAVPIQPFCPGGFPMPYYPAPYWNCSVPCAWSSVPWLSAPPTSPPTTNQKSPTLGKHSRDGDLLEPSNPFEKEPEPKNSERSPILIPKTLRIDDPDEAARSSIWATLGIKNDFISRRGLFEGFQPKGEEKKKLKAETPPAALLANPAALSRSLSFQEGM